MRERDIEQKLVKEILKVGGRTYKWVSPGNGGVPDRIIFLPDKRVIFAELKTDTGVLSAIQKEQIKRLRKLGQTVVVIRGESELNEFLEREVMPSGIHTAQLSETSDKQNNKR